MIFLNDKDEMLYLRGPASWGYDERSHTYNKHQHESKANVPHLTLALTAQVALAIKGIVDESYINPDVKMLLAHSTCFNGTLWLEWPAFLHVQVNEFRYTH